MRKQRWTIIYRLFGRSKTSEAWPTLFPAPVPVKVFFEFYANSVAGKGKSGVISVGEFHKALSLGGTNI